MKIWVFFIIFIIGIVLGVVGTLKAPELIQPYLPSVLHSKTITLEGEVVKKETSQGMLIMTLNTNKGALLAKFRKKAGEIEILVNKGDIVEIALRKYEPFVQDPSIKRVKKGVTQQPAKREEAQPAASEPEMKMPVLTQPEAAKPQEPVIEEGVFQVPPEEKTAEEKTPE
jgi:hypothetical protein